MKKGIKILVVLCIGFILVLSMFDCESKTTTGSTSAANVTSTKSTSTASSKSTSTSNVTAATSSAKVDSSISNLLSKGTGLTMKYDVKMTQSGQMVGMTIWQKGKKSRNESSFTGMKTVQIVDMEKMIAYSYTEGLNYATKFDLNQQDSTNTSSIDNSDLSQLMQYQPQISGEEILDGKTCTIIQVTISSITEKIWVWQDKGVPLKVETTSPNGNAKVEYSNYDFSNISDNMFELPAGMQVVEKGQIPGITTSLP